MTPKLIGLSGRDRSRPRGTRRSGPCRASPPTPSGTRPSSRRRRGWPLDGAAPRHRGSSEKWTLTIGTASSTWPDQPPERHHDPELHAAAQGRRRPRSVTGSPSSSAVAFTGLATSAPPRPRLRRAARRRRRTSWPASTSARNGTTDTSGVPRKARRTDAPVRAVGARRGPATTELGVAVAQLREACFRWSGRDVREGGRRRDGRSRAGAAGRASRRPRSRARCVDVQPVTWTSFGRTISNAEPHRQAALLVEHSPRASTIVGLTMTWAPVSSWRS